MSGYGWEEMREDEEIEDAYAEEREREREDEEEADRLEQAKSDAFDLGFAEYEHGLLRAASGENDERETS